MTRFPKRSEGCDNDVFFDIEAKRTPSIVGKFISKRSEHVYIKEFKNRSEANTFDSVKFISKRSEHLYIQNLNFEAKRSKFILNCESSEEKRTCLIVKKFISKRSDNVYIKEFKY